MTHKMLLLCPQKNIPEVSYPLISFKGDPSLSEIVYYIVKGESKRCKESPIKNKNFEEAMKYIENSGNSIKDEEELNNIINEGLRILYNK